jgi:MFS transporter, AAHS family, benzoate transport protein
MSTSTTTEQSDGRLFNAATIRVVLICWLTIIFEGYDLVVFGTVVPSLLHYKPWTLNPALVGAMASSIVLGMAVGALGVGLITDMIGRKATLIGSLLIFSIAMGLCGFAPSPIIFVVFRFIGGIGLGGFLPTSTALTFEYSSPKRRILTYTLMFTGYGVGGILASLLAIWLIPAFGWQVMFWVNGLACFVMAPVAYFLLPESVGFLLAKNRRAEAEQIASRFKISLVEEGVKASEEAAETEGKAGRWDGFKTLFTAPYIRATIIFAIVTFFTLFMVFGVNTWLPQLMNLLGYSLSSSLLFIAVLNIGNMIGNVIAGAVADRYGAKIVCITVFILGAISFVLLSLKLPLVIAFIFVILVGNGTLGAQNLLNIYVADRYPTGSRASAVGWALGAGRLGGLIGPNVIGLLQFWHAPIGLNFYILASSGLLCAIALFFLTGRPGTQAQLQTPLAQVVVEKSN